MRRGLDMHDTDLAQVATCAVAVRARNDDATIIGTSRGVGRARLGAFATVECSPTARSVYKVTAGLSARTRKDGGLAQVLQ
jgi:hypothetical protein